MKRSKATEEGEVISKGCIGTESVYPEQSKEFEQVQEMHSDFGKRKKIVLSGFPMDTTEEEIKDLLKDCECSIVTKSKDGVVKLLFSDVSSARSAIKDLNGLKYNNFRVAASFGHPDSLLFVGNLPLTYCKQKLMDLFAPYGKIIRCFIVYSVLSGKSKGYGFVEYSTREEAILAKQKTATKVVGLRSLRVDFADNGMQTCEDLQSKTLFVDKLPKGMQDDTKLRDMFAEYGTVNFCQIALTASATPRGFAFIDMNTSQAAESAQTSLNGSLLDGHEIRVSFGMPCRPGACILQPRNSNPIGGWLHPSNTINTSSSSWPRMPCISVAGLFHPTVTQCQISVPKEEETLAPSMTSSAPTTSLKQLLIPPAIFSSCSTLPALVTPSAENTAESKESKPLIEEVTINAETTLKKSIQSGQKRKHAEPTEFSATAFDEDSAYDKPYLGQHQQGIPFTHPLKRIRMQ